MHTLKSATSITVMRSASCAAGVCSPIHHSDEVGQKCCRGLQPHPSQWWGRPAVLQGSAAPSITVMRSASKAAGVCGPIHHSDEVSQLCCRGYQKADEHRTRSVHRNYTSIPHTYTNLLIEMQNNSWVKLHATMHWEFKTNIWWITLINRKLFLKLEFKIYILRQYMQLECRDNIKIT